MNNKSVGRIDHTGHDHPDTSWAKKQCRLATIEAAESKTSHSGRKRRVVKPTTPLEREAEASVALDKGEGGTFTVGEVSTPPTNGAVLATSSLRGVDLESLLNLAGYLEDTKRSLHTFVEWAESAPETADATMTVTVMGVAVMWDAEHGWTVGTL